MRNLIKKSLAFLLVAALALTCFVGTLTVSAENPTATITITADAVEAGATEIPVTLTVESEVGINEALIKVSSDLGTIAEEATLVASDAAAKIEYAEGTTDFGAFYLSALSPEGTENTELGEVTYAEIEVVFTNAGIAAKETPYTVNVEVPADKVIAASKDEEAIDIVCDGLEIVVEEAVVECDHANATKEVTTQPTKDAEGVMTYTCECGETWTEAIAKPVDITTLNAKASVQHNLVLLDRVTDRFVFSVKQFSNLGYDAVNNGYFVVVEYGKYESTASGYMSNQVTKTYFDEDKDVPNSSGNGRSFYFSELALYEMTTNYTTTVYVKDAEGVVVAYLSGVTSIATEALNLANKNSSETNLLICLADMMNYGKAAQDFFAKAGDDLSNAASPVDVLGTYMTNASDASILPATLPAATGLTKKVSNTAFNAKGNVVIGASTVPSYMVIAGNYAIENTEIYISYTDGYGSLVEDTVTVAPTLNSSGKYRYDFLFSKLAMYDLSETVTLSLRYNGVEEAVYEYSLSAFVNENISNATYKDILTKMALFSRSARIQLVKSAVY